MRSLIVSMYKLLFELGLEIRKVAEVLYLPVLNVFEMCFIDLEPELFFVKDVVIGLNPVFDIVIEPC